MHRARLGALLAASIVAMSTASPGRAPAADQPSLPCAATAFCSDVQALGPEQQAAMTGVSWRPGCPVALRDLRVLRVRYWGLADGTVHDGALVVHRDAVAALTRAFARLFSLHFPIARMVPIEAYGGDDDASTKADNTSAFNCRPAYGSTAFSEHAYGRAVDIDPVENPYVRADGSTLDPAAQRFADRAAVADEPGVITSTGAVRAAFRAVGWGWGGSWSSIHDYQHFSRSGR